MSQVQRQYTNQRMSKVVIHNNTVYLCGQVGVKGTSVAEQTAEALARVESLLIEAGSDRDHVLQTTVWLADMQDFDEMNGVWDTWFRPGFAPARACGEAKLASPELKVELLVTAALKTSTTQE
ncbi:RidA family protein [Vibrio hangzhouensis]|uniref:Enamine deaminase RidA, house cleaning of reactive enamine intermediates, YjgF/YER057c/UK114 family n=1 Tax=Vibrio hangzhouensis TaxID=462991 RepID=A0A1H5Y4H6_9VIBR|nr:RidA family protein [Vibrio hangzhouensis]SEG18959.1 Enamine deaminase RidA, house cleaning of reactive enamine intermediates, YjgF/YER057c/UK114 family [Vibrio hangzhouensis]